MQIVWVFHVAAIYMIITSDWSSAEAPPQLVLASGQGDGIPGSTEVCAPRLGSKKLHVRLQPILCMAFTEWGSLGIYT